MSQDYHEHESTDAGYHSGGDAGHGWGGSGDELSADALAYQRRKAFRRVIKYAIAFLLFASAVGFGIYAWGVKDRMQADLAAFEERGTDSAEAFLADLQAEHYDDAYQKTSTDYRKRTSAKQFEDYVQKRRDVIKEPFKDHKFKSKQGSLALFGKKVTAQYRGTRKTIIGKSEEVVITMVRENGQIKVDDLSISQ